MLRGPWIILAALLITWQLVKLRRVPTPGAAAILGGIVGAALLINEGFLPLPVLVLAVVFSWVHRLRRFAVLTAAFGAGLAVAVSPLVVRNWLVGAPALQFAVSGGYGYALWNAADSEPLFFPAPPASFLPLMATTDGRFSKAVWGCLRSFPSAGEFLRLYLRRVTGLVVPLEIPDNVNFYYAALKDPLLRPLPTYALVFPLIVIGLYLGARRYRDLGALVPGSLTFFLSIMLTQPTSRYRLQLVVLLLPFAGCALAQAFRWIRVRNFAALIVAASAMVLCSLGTRFLEQSVVLKAALINNRSTLGQERV